MKKTILFILFFLLPAAIPARAERILIDIDQTSGQSLPIAIVPLKTLDNQDAAFFHRFNAILERDLRMTGLFRILSRKSFLEPDSAAITLEGTDFSLWRKSGADALVKGGYRRTPQGYVLELRLFDVQQRQSILGKRYTFEEEGFARAVHAFADQMILKLTGEAGVFSSTRIACVFVSKGKKEIVEMAVDGSDLAVVTQHRSITLGPSWSRDGRYIAYTSYFERNPNIYLRDRKTSQSRKLSNRPGLNLGAAFAPNKDWLAAAVSNNADPELLLLDMKGEVLRTLTNNFWIDIEPSWSPDGKQLAYVSNESGQPHIYKLNADGSGVKRLTYQGYHNVSPAWSPRGDKIAFAGRDEGFFDIFIMDTNGSNIQRLTMNNGNNESPSFSPNGQMIAFTSSRTGREQIYVMGLDGRGQTQITDGVSKYSEPAWSPPLKP